ncbi:MAG: DsrE family protein [Actinomycetota bacterium]
MRRLLSVAVLGLGITAAVAGAASANEYYGHQKVVYHVNGEGGDKDRSYMMALTNVQNQINAVGKDNIEVKVVLHGDGLDLLKDARDNMALQSKVIALKEQKVQFLVCNNTLVGRHMDANRDLYDVEKEDIVPSGVAELSRLQMKGYTYIRP